MKELPVRKHLRLKGYNYSHNGMYYITMCVKDRHELLGKIVGAIINRPQCATCVSHCDANVSHSEANTHTPNVLLSDYGKITDNAINAIQNHYIHAVVDKYVIMPNHVHIILILCENDMNGRLIIAPTSVSYIVQQLKRYITKQIGFSLWQKSFHDHIIRDEAEYQRISQYIDENPERWAEDEFYIDM